MGYVLTVGLFGILFVSWNLLGRLWAASGATALPGRLLKVGFFGQGGKYLEGFRECIGVFRAHFPHVYEGEKSYYCFYYPLSSILSGVRTIWSILNHGCCRAYA